jgi:uncharacterized membrane protein YfcA
MALLIIAVVFLAIFTQSIAGFGLALIAMPLLVEGVGIELAAPLIALVGATAELIILLRYRSALNWRAVGPLSAASLLGIPLGVYSLRYLDAHIVPIILGVIILGYALYALFAPRLPEIRREGWAYGFGFVAGLLSGAYNTSGPPVVIYGNCRQWLPAEFKCNLQGFFLLNSAAVIATHALSGNFTRPVWQAYGLALPAIGLGLVAGFALDRRIEPALFRKIVLLLLIILGVRLIL